MPESINNPQHGEPKRSLWLAKDRRSLVVLDQTRLPHRVETVTLRTLQDAARAISDMIVRGAPLIGVTAAYGMALAMAEDASDASLGRAYDVLIATRPTAVNLRWALDLMRAHLAPLPSVGRRDAAFLKAAEVAEEDVAANHALGLHGLNVLQRIARRRGGEPLRILTHCNAGRLATVAWGTATAPMYLAHDHGIPIHVLVSETRPRNQGASLTAWELLDHGIPHTVVADNSAGHLLQRGLVDVVIVGADRVTRRGDVANKVGTYLKALAARAHGVPFHVALPTSTIDWTLEDGVRGIPIEQRSQREVTHVAGTDARGRVVEVRLTPEGSPARNDAFDVTPFGLVTGFITERGLCPATREGLRRLQPRGGSAGLARATRPRKLPATK